MRGWRYQPIKTGDSVKSERLDCYEVVTQRIIDLLNQGTIPWQKPWKSNGGLPKNLVSGKHYRGMNTFLLHSMNYDSPYWVTYKQAADLGGNVRKGEKACPVIFWKRWEKVDKATGEKSSIPMMRFYYVFNIAQCDGLKNLFGENITGETTPETPAEITGDYSKAESLVSGYKGAPEVRHGMARAYYSPGADYIGLPDNARFSSIGHYYATLFHEMAHSTGHPSRLNRPGINNPAIRFGDSNYSKEELVAEMGSAFLCGLAGIGETGGLIQNAAAYVAGWLKALRDDKKLVIQAAGQAQRAVDFICGTTYEETETTPATIPAATTGELITA